MNLMYKTVLILELFYVTNKILKYGKTHCTYADSMSQRDEHTVLMQTPCHNAINTLYLCRLHVLTQ